MFRFLEAKIPIPFLSLAALHTKNVDYKWQGLVSYFSSRLMHKYLQNIGKITVTLLKQCLFCLVNLFPVSGFIIKNSFKIFTAALIVASV